jgi:glycosyltransferase involved in cell wall biosynthesis
MKMASPHPRIAIVAASPDIVGGQGVQAQSLVGSLERDGYAVTFVPIDVRLPRAVRWVRRVPGLRTIVNQLFYVPSLLRLARVDVAHIFSASYWSFLLAPLPAMLVARAFNKRVVLHYHSGEADDHLSRWGVLVHPWLRLADTIVVPSEYLREVFARHGYTVRVIANVVDLSRFRYRPRRPLQPRLLSTRNFEAYYRVDLVIDAFARFRRVVPEATLTLAGYGSRETSLREQAARLAGDAIRFVGTIGQAAMAELLAEHDIFINASVLDNQPVSLLEAFASGLPVVSSATGDIPYMLRRGDAGWLAAPGDAAALADALIALWRDPDGALARARCARERVTDYTWSAVRTQWADVYTETPHLDEIALATQSR